MVTRRALVVGSQCAALGPGSSLSFLPRLTQDLTTALDASWDVVEIVHNPGLSELKDRIKAAFRQAADEQATLLIALIGHGIAIGRDYYYLPFDGEAVGDSDVNLALAQKIKEQLRHHGRQLDTVMVIVDTCASGAVADQAGADWLSEADSAFAVMTASYRDEAENGNFTRALIEIIERGSADDTEWLTWNTAFAAIKRDLDASACLPQQMNRNGSVPLARNRAHGRPGPPLRRAVTARVLAERTLDAYRLPEPADCPLAAVDFTERDRLQLGVAWGLDRRPWTGVVVDPPDADLAAQLDAVEETVAAAAAEAGLDLPRRRWTRLPADPPAGGDVLPAHVLPVPLDPDAAGLTPARWRELLAEPLHGVMPGAPVVVELLTPSLVAGVRAAAPAAAALAEPFRVTIADSV